MANTLPVSLLEFLVRLCTSARSGGNSNDGFHCHVPFRTILSNKAQHIVTMRLNYIENLRLCNLNRGRRLGWIVPILQIIVYLRTESMVDGEEDLRRHDD